MVNLFLLLCFFIFNKWNERAFEAEKEEVKKGLKELIDKNSFDDDRSGINEILDKKVKYRENDEVYRMFKKMYIKKNLIKKDYCDLKDVFSKFISDGFLKEISVQGIEKISLGIAVKKYIHVMFLDIIHFTTLTETLAPEKVLFLLNIYFEGVINIIKKHSGHVDKFLGDGIMVIFDNKYADGVIKASLEIQDFSMKFVVPNIGETISVGIGIHSGDVTLGTIGTHNRMDATIVGDVVNVASRIQGITRNANGKRIIISDKTYESIKNKQNFFIKEIGYRTLRGRKSRTRLYFIDRKF